MKKFWKYLLIVMLLLMGLACVGVLYLFFVPNSSLFGITYISYNKVLKSEDYSFENVEKLTLNSRKFDVKILPTTASSALVKVHCHSFGFVLEKNKELAVNGQMVGGELVLNVSEPYGAALPNGSYIEVFVPNKTVDLQLKNVNAKTTVSGGSIKINNLTYKSQNGNFNFQAGEIFGGLDLDLGNSDFKISSGVTTNNNNVSLKLTSGKLDAQESSFGEINIKSNNRGVVLVKECLNITEEIKTAGGRIKIGTVGNVHIVTSDTNLYFDKITAGAVVSLTAAGNVEVKELNGSSTFTTENGRIFIGKANSTLTLASNHGSITVDNAYLGIAAKSNYGTIKISYANDAQSFNENAEARNLVVETKNGKIVANGVEHINSLITGSGRAKITLKNVYGKNQIIAKDRGSVDVVVDKDAKYMLKTSAKGSVNVNLTQTDEYSGYKTNKERTTYVNCLEETYNAELDAELLVTVGNGDIYLVDTNFI